MCRSAGSAYPIDMALETLAGFRTIILIGAPDPVAFFGYPASPRGWRIPKPR